MYFEHGGNRWWIDRSPSIFTSRNGKEDVGIYKRGGWGRRQPDGKLYRCCLRLAAEDGSLLRDYEAIPPHVNVEWLKQVGFIALQH